MPYALRIRRHRQTHAGHCERHAVPARLGFQALHLDGGHATGASRQAQPRYRRQSVSRFQDSTQIRRADHAARSDDAHRRLRRDRARPLGRKCERSLSDPRIPHQTNANPHLCAGKGDRVFQLRCDAGRVHRAARLGRAFRYLCRPAHLHAAAHDPLDVRPAAAAVARSANGVGLHNLGRQESNAVRIRRSGARRSLARAKPEQSRACESRSSTAFSTGITHTRRR